MSESLPRPDLIDHPRQPERNGAEESEMVEFFRLVLQLRQAKRDKEEVLRRVQTDMQRAKDIQCEIGQLEQHIWEVIGDDRIPL